MRHHKLNDSLATRLLQLLIALFVTRCTAEPQAISATFGTDFIGYDGAWSPVQIRVGTPEQWLSVLPNTMSSETWLAGPAGCDGTATCATLRGGTFYRSNSTTWNNLGQYELGYSALSSTTETADYGFDNISLSDTINAPSQIIAIVSSVDHWVGDLGLNVQETRFTGTTNHLAFISTLVQNESVIPSHSYGYTAGASYQGRGVPGSLTLGGVDTTRYNSNQLWLDLAPGYIPSAILRSFEVSASVRPADWTNNPIALMSSQQAAAVTIDSSTPYLWLPRDICDNIADALNLTWDANLDIYRFSNDTPPSTLSNLNLKFTIRLANDAKSSEQIGLGLSFGAFNLQLSYPFPGLFSNYTTEKVSYFPLRRANSTQQYTLGRAFLQETYLTVDYERNRFQLAQAQFPDASTLPALVSIERPKNSTFPGPGGIMGSAGLSTGAKAGIAVGVALGVIALALAIWFFCFRRRNKQGVVDDEKKSQKTLLFSIFSRRSTRPSSATNSSAAELTADKRQPTEMVSDSSTSRFELSGNEPVEMSAAEVSPSFFQERINTHISQRNDPRSPVELNQPLPRSSVSKDDERFNPIVPHEDPVPEYTPSDGNTIQSNSISPFSRRHPNNPFGTSDRAVSPVTGTSSDRDRLSNRQHTRNASGSSNGRSPVSPTHLRNDGVHSHSSAQSGKVSQPSSGSRHLSVPTDQPIRSASRGSRFREDLATNATKGTLERDNVDNSDTRSRFSWER